MQLSIRHETLYHYTATLAYTIQQLHLTPRAEPQQHVLQWQLDAPGHLHAYTDAYGNLSHMLTLDKPHEALAIVAEGVVETTAPPQGRVQTKDTLSPLVYTVATRLTAPDEAIRALAAAFLPGQRVGTRELMALAGHIHGAVAYQTGATEVTTTAGAALAQGRGVCQDHAHIFLACCHAAGIPARYVSGYIDPGYIGLDNADHAASHAWVDAWAHDDGFAGWVSIDVTHARLMTDAYCRIAIGRDYEAAAPIRGMRAGGGDESMKVEVQIVPQ